MSLYRTWESTKTMYFNIKLLSLLVDFITRKRYNQYMRGDYFVVEKVKPDPLNLLVKTDVGKQSVRYCI